MINLVDFGPNDNGEYMRLAFDRANEEFHILVVEEDGFYEFENSIASIWEDNCLSRLLNRLLGAAMTLDVFIPVQDQKVIDLVIKKDEEENFEIAYSYVNREFSFTVNDEDNSEFSDFMEMLRKLSK